MFMVMLFGTSQEQVSSVTPASSQFLRQVMLAGKMIILGKEVCSVVRGMQCPVCWFPTGMCYCPHSSMGSCFCHQQAETRPLYCQLSETQRVVMVFYFSMKIKTFQNFFHPSCLKKAWIEYVQQGTRSQHPASQHKADVNMTTHKTLRRHCKGSKAFHQVCKPLSHLNDTVQVKGKNPIVLMKS